jgi:hypothetical protein
MNPSIQYFKPPAPHLFVGDCMPFAHGGLFSFFYLLDEGHHKGLGGLGGHQWALATSSDLARWQHHPLAIPLSTDWEGSICTGSVLYHQGCYYAFYATRRRDYTQHLSLALSRDGLTFEKTEPNPFFSPPAGYNPFHFRDPFAFRDPAGQFHLLVTACLEEPILDGRGGCLAHLQSADLRNWTLTEPFFIPGTPDVPECPDLFEWGGWYYLIYSSGLSAHYRMSRSWRGPWQHPGVDTFEGSAARVMKTAAWGERRIGAAWIGERLDGEFLWGGQAVFRELIQRGDGTLGVSFVPEMALPRGEPISPLLSAVTPGAAVTDGLLSLSHTGELEAASCANVPENAYIRMSLGSDSGAGPFGLRLRAAQDFTSGVELSFHFAEGIVRLGGQELRGCALDRQNLDLEIYQFGTILDVCINQEHCLIERVPDARGDTLWFWALDGSLEVSGLEIRQVSEDKKQ